jgi:hypothetical protein
MNRSSGDQIWNQRLLICLRLARMFLAIKPGQAQFPDWTGTWGVNLGVHKDFHLGDRITDSGRRPEHL